MSSATPTQATDPTDELFSAAEFRILRHYFEFGDTRDEALDQDIASLGLDGVTSLSAALAGIVLRSIQNRLPRWTGRSDDGSIVYGRKYYLPKSERKLLLKPRRVHGASGFGAGPGMSWSISYHVVWLPIFDRFVVTESSDDAGCSDSADHAVGHFQSDLPHDVEKIDAILAPYRAWLAEATAEDEYCEEG